MDQRPLLPADEELHATMGHGVVQCGLPCPRPCTVAVAVAAAVAVAVGVAEAAAVAGGALQDVTRHTLCF